MAKKGSRVGQWVRIDHPQGMPEFDGKVGRIISYECDMYRVFLNAPVEINGVGRVTDDLWEGRYLKRFR